MWEFFDGKQMVWIDIETAPAGRKEEDGRTLRYGRRHQHGALIARTARTTHVAPRVQRSAWRTCEGRQASVIVPYAFM